MAYLVTTLTGSESRAAEWLHKSFGIDCYLPMVETQRLSHGVMLKHIEPLFRGYLFILNLVNQWRDVLETRGVLRFLTSGDHPEEIRDREIEVIRDREDERGLIQIAQKPDDPDKFMRGQRLIVNSGAFVRKSVIHSGLTIGKREFVFFELIGAKRHRFEFDHEELTIPPPLVELRAKTNHRQRRRRKHGKKTQSPSSLAA